MIIHYCKYIYIKHTLACKMMRKIVASCSNALFIIISQHRLLAMRAVLRSRVLWLLFVLILVNVHLDLFLFPLAHVADAERLVDLSIQDEHIVELGRLNVNLQLVY